MFSNFLSTLQAVPFENLKEMPVTLNTNELKDDVNCKVPFQKDTDISALNRIYLELLSRIVTEKSDLSCRWRNSNGFAF